MLDTVRKVVKNTQKELKQEIRKKVISSKNFKIEKRKLNRFYTDYVV